MGSSAGLTCARILLFIFNVLFLLAGLALVIIGAIAQVKLTTYSTAIGNVNGVAIFLIVIGSIIVIISFFGCCGAWQKNYCMLITFCILMAIMLIVVIAALIAAFVLRNKVNGLLSVGLKSSITDYNTNISATVDVWDGMQKEFQCCGVNNYSDWSANTQLTITGNNSVPNSCCLPQYAMQTRCGYYQQKNATMIYKQGCINGVEDFIRRNLAAVGGVAAAVAILMLIGIIIAGCLAHHVHGEYHAV